mmetsp:Transcript_15744/g.43015  ORF Transcript_15744/g.43015 Transcript_15744/m.43015 type:complete len:98 (+) Transcript_15744:234-527(+)
MQKSKRLLRSASLLRWTCLLRARRTAGSRPVSLKCPTGILLSDEQESLALGVSQEEMARTVRMAPRVLEGQMESTEKTARLVREAILAIQAFQEDEG